MSSIDGYEAPLSFVRVFFGSLLNQTKIFLSDKSVVRKEISQSSKFSFQFRICLLSQGRKLSRMLLMTFEIIRAAKHRFRQLLVGFEIPWRKQYKDHFI